MIETFRFRIGETEHRKRLDEFLFDQIGAVSKMHLRRLLLENKCAVNSAAEKPGYRLRENDFVEIEVDLSAETSMKPEAVPLEILFEDEEILVVNKPAEMLVHPTRNVKSGTLLNALSFHLNFSPQRHEDAKLEPPASAGGCKAERNSPQMSTDEHRFENQGSMTKDEGQLPNPKSNIVRPGLIHRLDKKTSGLMVIAKTRRAHRILADHFRRKLVEKKYFALVEGIVREELGTIDAPVGYDEPLKKWRVSESGKPAETRFLVLERRAGTTLLELEPVTGRTNQLRIHCEFIGHPIVGDEGRGGREFSRLCLHAAKLSFWHPDEARRLEFETALPEEMSR